MMAHKPTNLHHVRMQPAGFSFDSSPVLGPIPRWTENRGSIANGNAIRIAAQRRPGDPTDTTDATGTDTEEAKIQDALEAMNAGFAEQQERQRLEDSRIANDTEGKALVGSKPTLFVSEPNEDTWRFGFYEPGPDAEEGGAVVDDENPEQNIAEAPAAAREVVDAMMAAAPGLADITTIQPGDEGDNGGQVIVIANPGTQYQSTGMSPGHDLTKACLEALNTPKELWSYATLEFNDWGEHLEYGFNHEAGETPDEDELDTELEELLSLTKTMNEELDKHFTFGFTDDVVEAPMIYGGYSSDGNIVGVLTKRVWT